jgi:hypothetical protein
MQLDDNPFFRKPITSWYDSNFVCRTVIVMMVFIFIFAVAGIIVGLSTEEFRGFVWLPVFLSVSSLFLLLKIAFRIKHRSKTG